jgi:hypothetical protein
MAPKLSEGCLHVSSFKVSLLKVIKHTKLKRKRKETKDWGCVSSNRATA